MQISDLRPSRYGSALLLAGLAFCLSGCLGGPLASGQENPELARNIVVDQSLKITAPKGYCIDQAASRPKGRRASIVMGRCDALGGLDAPSEPGLLTVVVRRNTRNESDQGALTRNWLTSTGAEVIDLRTDGSLVLAQARDAQAPTSGLSSHHWRTVVTTSDHVISARLSEFENQKISSSRGFLTLKSLADGIKADIAVSDPETIHTVSETRTNENAPRPPGLFARIFRSTPEAE